jgi:hypothetical protein
MKHQEAFGIVLSGWNVGKRRWMAGQPSCVPCRREKHCVLGFDKEGVSAAAPEHDNADGWQGRPPTIRRQRKGDLIVGFC